MAQYCAAAYSCVEVDVTPPPDAVTEKRWNMVGNPFPYPVDWRDVRIVVAGDPCIGTTTCPSPGGADTAGYGFEIIQKWNGAAYEPSDENTPGMEGVLNPGEGFWYAVDDHTLNPGDIKILIPPIHSTGPQAFNDPGEPETTMFASVSKILSRIADLFIAPAHAASGGNKSQGRKVGLLAKEWYVRLIAEWPEGNLKDRGNVLGELIDSKPGYDPHDLEELSPFGRHLTIVFPHDDWGERAGNYASDYRALKKNKHGGDSWQFEVRSDQPGREITLRWEMQGDYPEAPLLINLDTGEMVEIDSAVPGSHTFVMESNTHRFEWSY